MGYNVSPNVMTTPTVYCYHCIPTGKKYIGQTVNEEDRKKQHKFHAKAKVNNSKFHKAVRKYGWDSFIYGVIDYCDDVNAMDELEKESISEYDTVLNGYNLTEGGLHFTHSKETRDLISQRSRDSRDRAKQTREERYRKERMNGERIDGPHCSLEWEVLK